MPGGHKPLDEGSDILLDVLGRLWNEDRGDEKNNDRGVFGAKLLFDGPIFCNSFGNEDFSVADMTLFDYGQNLFGSFL